MEQSGGKAFSPLQAGGAVAGRRARQVRLAEPECGQAADTEEQPSTGAPARGVKFAPEPARRRSSSSSEGPAASAHQADAPPVAAQRRVGFELPAGGSADSASPAGEGAAAASPGGSGGGVPPPRGAVGGGFSGVSRRKQAQLEQQAAVADQRRAKYDEREVDHAADAIPDLEEQGYEDLTRVVANAPRSRRTLLPPGGDDTGNGAGDAWLPAAASAAAAAGIDLSLLTAALLPSKLVEDEGDEVWDPDRLLSLLKAELAGVGDTATTATGDRDEFLAT